MKKVAIALWIFFFPLWALASEKSDVKSVKNSLNQFVESWNKGDMQAALEIYKDSPESLLISDAVIKGYPDIANFWKKSYPDKEAMGSMVFSDIEVKMLSGQYAMAIGKWTLKSPKSDAGGIFTVLFEKTKHGWKSVVDHTTGLS